MGGGQEGTLNHLNGFPSKEPAESSVVTGLGLLVEAMHLPDSEGSSPSSGRARNRGIEIIIEVVGLPIGSIKSRFGTVVE